MLTCALSSKAVPAVSKEKHLKNLIFMATKRTKSTEQGSEVQKHFILPSAIFLRKQNKTKSACFKTHSKGFWENPRGVRSRWHYNSGMQIVFSPGNIRFLCSYCSNYSLTVKRTVILFTKPKSLKKDISVIAWITLETFLQTVIACDSLGTVS